MISQKKREIVVGDSHLDFTPTTSKEADIVLGGDVIFGDQLLDEVIKDPTINIYLDRSPKLNTPKDYEEMVKRLQRQRALFITAEQKRKEPKIEGED